MLTIASRIERILSHYGLNNVQMAKRIGVSSPVVTHLKSGRNKPSFEMIVSIARSFPELNLSWLILGEGSMIQNEDRLTKMKSAIKGHLDEINKEISKMDVLIG